LIVSNTWTNHYRNYIVYFRLLSLGSPRENLFIALMLHIHLIICIFGCWGVIFIWQQNC